MGMGRDRIVILSDTRLGRLASRTRSVDALRPLWNGAAEMIIDGQLPEVHDATYRVRAVREVLGGQDLCKTDGVHLWILSDNHDPLLSARCSLRLRGGEIVITHGDVHPAAARWTREGIDGCLRAAHFNWDEFATLPAPKCGVIHRSYDMLNKVVQVRWYWQNLPRREDSFARDYAPECRSFVFGHIHRAGNWRLDGCLIINAGGVVFPSRPRSVILENRQLVALPIHAAGRRRCDGTRPLASFALRRAAKRIAV